MGFYRNPGVILKIPMELFHYFLHPVWGKNYLGYPGLSGGRLSVALQKVVCHFQGVSQSPVTLVAGTTVSDVLPLATLSSPNFP
jgi:hypothetical protein